jgi:PAS domain S-box-containing protein
VGRPTGGYELFRPDGTAIPVEEMPLMRAIGGELVRDARVLVRHASGREVIIRVSASPVRDASENVVGAVATLQDVTERERLQEQLRLSEARLDAFFNRSPVGLFIFDEQLRYVRANPDAAKIIGLPPEQIPGRYIGDHKGSLGPDLVPRLEKVIRTGRPETDVAVSGTPPGAQGVERHWLSSHFPITGPGGVRGVGVIAVEVTERIRAERRLQFLAQIGSVLAASLDYGETMQQVCEIAVKEMADWCFVDLLEGESGGVRRVAVAHADPSQAQLAARFRRYFPGKESSPFGVSVVLRERRGNLVAKADEATIASVSRDPEHLELLHAIRIRSFISAPLVARGRLLGALSLILSEGSTRSYGEEELRLVEEVARRTAVAVDNARLYAEAQEANAAREQFMNIVSHELRNPLSTIQTGIHLLRKSVPAEAVRRLEVIQRAADLQARLVEDLLDVARAARGKLQLVMAPVQLDRIVATALEGARADAQAAELELDAQIEPGLWVRGDADRLQQVVLNLLTNAVKFTPAGRRIHVRLYEKSGLPQRKAWLEVEDEGVGIPKESLAKIFGLFEQLGAAPQRKRGLGIGLAMVKSITEKHGGRVGAESEGQGKGSRFTVELPLIEPPGPAAAEKGETVETAVAGA